MIRFACPNCEKVYTVPAASGGKPATCKQCGTRFQIPDAPPSVEYEVVEEPAPAPPPPPALPPPPPAPPPPPPAVQHAETMVLPSLPDLPSKQIEIPSIPALPDLNTAPPPAPPPPSNLSFGVSPPAPPPPADTPATVVLQPCPTCGARLTVNAEDVGAHVECPMCKTVFQGQAAQTPTVVAPTPPPPPAPADVDIAPCPKCRAELTVSETDLGQDVECPHCQTVYKAERPQPKAGTQLAKSVRGAAPPPSRGGDDTDKKKPYEFKPKKKKDKDSPFAEDDDDRDRNDDDDDDDDDDRPRRKKKKKRRRSRSRSYDDYDDDRYRSYSPHDGGAMLIWAIVGLFCCWFISIYVLIKSSQSINEIRNGTMDPSGRGLLEAARIIAIIDLILVVLAIVRQIFFIGFVGAGAASNY